MSGGTAASAKSAFWTFNNPFYAPGERTGSRDGLAESAPDHRTASREPESINRDRRPARVVEMRERIQRP